MTRETALQLLRAHATGRLLRMHAETVARAFDRRLDDLHPRFRAEELIPVPEVACALAGLPIEIPPYLIDRISAHNTERATRRLAKGNLGMLSPDA